MQDAARRHDKNWKVPTSFRAELKKDMYLLSPKCPSYVQSACNIMMLEKYLMSNLVVVQAKFTLKPWLFDYDLSHWIMRQHSQLSDTTITNAQGKEEKVPKEYFLYVDHCMKAAKEEHGKDQ
ncbi:hypothetical protein DACRYDRAFT_22388, partial [Dacryopinax primogenitus]